MEVPWESSTYLHRIGRSGRFGSYGLALTIASEGKETIKLQNVVYETGSNVYKLVKSEGEYVIPDLWKLKQNSELEGFIIDLDILEGIEPTTEVKSENENEKHTAETVSLSDKFENSKKSVKKEYVDEYEENHETFEISEIKQEELDISDYYETHDSDFEDESDHELPEDYLVTSFKEALGETDIKIEASEDMPQVERDFGEILEKYSDQLHPYLEWPLDLEKIKNDPTNPKLESEDISKLNHLGQILLSQKFNYFKESIERNKSCIKDCKKAVNDLLDGQELEQSPLEQDWHPVEASLEDVSTKEVLFDLRSGLKVELDQDFYMNHDRDDSSLAPNDYDYLEQSSSDQAEFDPMTWHTVDQGYDQVMNKTSTPEYDPYDDQGAYQIHEQSYEYTPNPNAGHDNAEIPSWNPFPDPDASLPPDLYQIHKNQWLRSQYQLWLQNVQKNRNMVESNHLTKH